MPKAVLSEEMEKPKRAPRKRVAAVEGEAIKTPRKRAPRKVSEVDDELETKRVAKVSPERKAPTLIASEIDRKKARKKQLLIASLVILVGFGTSAAIGFSDSGKIDINATISDRNAGLSPDQSSQLIPVQNTSQEPDGGLIGLGDVPAPVVETATTSASSTDPTASSTTPIASSTPVGNIPMNEPDFSETSPE